MNGANFGHSAVVTSFAAPTAAISPNVSSISSDNAVAYRPMYQDRNSTNLAAVFINNLQVLYPCVANTELQITCRLSTFEEDAFEMGSP